MPRQSVVLFALVLCYLPTLEAQRVAVPGDTVRVRPVGVTWQVRGVIESITETAVLILQADGEPTSLHPHRIQSMHVLDGRAPGWGKGALLGAAAGAAVGAGVGLSQAGSGGDIGGEAVPIGMLSVGLIGGLAGALLSSGGSRERWVAARVQAVVSALRGPAAVRGAPAGTALAVSWRIAW